MARKQTFEAGMSELEALTERLAEGDMTLDETIKTCLLYTSWPVC